MSHLHLLNLYFRFLISLSTLIVLTASPNLVEPSLSANPAELNDFNQSLDKLVDKLKNGKDTDQGTDIKNVRQDAEKLLELSNSFPDNSKVKKIASELLNPLISEDVKIIQQKRNVSTSGKYKTETHKKVSEFITQNKLTNEDLKESSKNGSADKEKENNSVPQGFGWYQYPKYLNFYLPLWAIGSFLLLGLQGLLVYQIVKFRGKTIQGNETTETKDKEIVRLKGALGKLKKEHGDQTKELQIIKQQLSQAKDQQEILRSQKHSQEQYASIQPAMQPVQYRSPVPPVGTPEQQMMESYNSDRRGFSNKYQTVLVSEDAQALSERWGGEQKKVILNETSQGDYWIFSFHQKDYLVPTNKITINEFSLRTVGSIFECDNYTASYNSFRLVEPAIVSKQPAGGKQAWIVERKGRLIFS